MNTKHNHSHQKYILEQCISNCLGFHLPLLSQVEIKNDDGLLPGIHLPAASCSFAIYPLIQTYLTEAPIPVNEGSDRYSFFVPKTSIDASQLTPEME